MIVIYRKISYNIMVIFQMKGKVMNIRAFLAIIVCRAVKLAAKILRRGGTAMPGRFAVKVCPDLAAILSRNVRVIMVTGTNGKTTTSRMIEQGLIDSGADCFSNRSGANLLSGVTTTLVEHSTLFGKSKHKCAVIECDEAAFKTVAPLVKPEVILVLNLFRDQLDRYGEITHTLGNIREGILGVPSALVCLNADCSLTASLAGDIPNQCLFYGLGEALGGGEAPAVSDASHCIRCKAEYVYQYRTYGHLGHFCCPECGYERPNPDITVTKLLEKDADSSTVEFSVGPMTRTVRINLPAAYNIYNAAGAAAALIAFGVETETALRCGEKFQCGFGRMERFLWNGTAIRMILVKNPAGCNQVIEYLTGLGEDFLPVFLLNDNPADSTDISWIWDADYEKFAAAYEGDTVVSGIRADDMALRLKYAGIPAERIVVQRDFDTLLEEITAQEKPVFMIPTYTAMLDIRTRLAHLCGTSEFWE